MDSNTEALMRLAAEEIERLRVELAVEKARNAGPGSTARDALARVVAKAQGTHNAAPVAKDGAPRETVVVKHGSNVPEAARGFAKDFRKTRAEDVEKSKRVAEKLNDETDIQRMNRVFRETGVHPTEQKRNA